jgi:phosphate transport system substrate-binding protein
MTTMQMLFSKFVSTALVGVGSLILCIAPAWATETALRIQGATTFESEILSSQRSAIEAKLGRSLDVVANKSSWGLLALIDGRADLAMISAPLEAEIEAARLLKTDQLFDRLLEFKIASTRIAFPVNSTNTVSRLSLETLRKILVGSVTNWNAVGGPDLPILVVCVKEGGGTIVAARSRFLGNEPLATNAIRLESANHLLTVIAQEPGAIGIAQLGLVRRAGLKEVLTGFPIEQPLSFVTLGDPSPILQRMIEITRESAGNDRD